MLRVNRGSPAAPALRLGGMVDIGGAIAVRGDERRRKVQRRVVGLQREAPLRSSA